MSIQRHGFVVVLSCYVFGLWQVFDRVDVKPLSVLAPTFAVSTDDWNTLIKDKDSYYAQDMVELNQFRKAVLRAKPPVRGKHRPAHRVDDFKYNIKSACDAKGIAIVIDELYHANHTRGGSSFRVVSTSEKLRQTCSFHDFFNGTYVTFCLMNQTDCTNVTIYIMYVDFTIQTRYVRRTNYYGGIMYVQRDATQLLPNHFHVRPLLSRNECSYRMGWHGGRTTVHRNSSFAAVTVEHGKSTSL